jgi:asparagine synthase (glutamine-hydrolysing)
MCGIFGIYSYQLPSSRIIESAVTTLYHRGPDDEGYWLFNQDTKAFISCGGKDTDRRLDLPKISEIDTTNYHLAFGFRRLSILDLSPAGHQPMSSINGRYWITFNGEIYNYIELRQELGTVGYEFRTDSDTEVILAAYQHWGVNCFTHLVGMWGLAICDLAAGKLLLSRDQFGIKPLYYSTSGDMLVWGSEIKSLLELPHIKRKVDPQSLNDFLRHGITDAGAQTLFADVLQLPSAHYAIVDLTKPSPARLHPIAYWQLEPKSGAIPSFADAAAELQHLFLDSIKLHLRSDVPIGAALSGGIDSSAIVAGMRHISPDLDLRTFTFVAEEESKNEEKWADIVADQAHAQGYKTKPTPEELVAGLDDLVFTQDEPFGSTSIFAQHCVFRLAKQHGVTVMLDGQGADEMLAGYPWYRGARFGSLIRQFKLFDALTFQRNSQLLPGAGSLKYLAMTAGAAILPPQLQETARKFSGMNIAETWMNRAWFDGNSVIPETMPHVSGQNILREKLIQSIQLTLPMLLRYEDRNSMKHSIESRVPFLTSQLAEYIISLPEEYLISSQGTTKSIFRAAMRGIMPDVILDRQDKVAFATPEQKWLRQLQPWVDGLLISDVAQGIPAIEYAQLQQEWQAVKNHTKPLDFRFWRWINTIAWTQRFEVRY